MSIREGKNSCEVIMPNFPDGSSCGNSIYQASGMVSKDTLFIPTQALGNDSVSGYGVVSGDQLTMVVDANSGSHIIISATRQR
jgi:hypothetical protein